MLATNKVLRGRYRVIQPLGQGAMSAVYEVYDGERETNVALKEILIDLEKISSISHRETLKHEFANQAKILAKVKHESLPQVRGYFSEIDRQYLVMELIDGTNVSEMLAKNDNTVEFSEVTNWADQLLDALDYLHTLAPPIIHCDINPKNVKLTSRGRIKLLGFNIATAANVRASAMVKNHNSADAQLYLSPEQSLRTADEATQKTLSADHNAKLRKILNQPIDGRSDIYALGATLYHLMTGQVPVDAPKRTLEIWSGKADPLPKAHDINSTVPVEISDVLSKALAIECESRFESAAQMRGELQTAAARAKKREAEESKQKEAAAARELLQAEEKRLEQERQMVEQERLKIEEERKQQAQLIEKQLKEAEAQRLEAEKRAAEAEKRLSENASQTAARKNNSQAKSGKAESVFGETNTLFAAEPEANKKPAWIMPVAALIFLVVIGATAGILLMGSSNAASNQSVSDPAESSVEKTNSAESTVAAPPPATVENTPETTQLPATTSSPSPTPAPAVVGQNPSKNRTTSQPTPAPRTAKSTSAPTAPPKAPANQKKAVTVDDLIGN